LSVISVAAMLLVKAITGPTDRSTPPVRITIVWPSAAIASVMPWLAIEIACAALKRGSRPM
jgi:hypothetical protein